MSGITGGLLDFFIIHHKGLFKDGLWIMLILGVVIMVPAVACNGLYNWSIAYHAQYVADHNPAPSSTAPGGATLNGSKPTEAPKLPIETITVDTEALARNNPYPAPFTHDPIGDPNGAYFNMFIDVGFGAFPAVYIVPDTWQKYGGRISTGKEPTNYVYYTVYTHDGEVKGAHYDRQHNIIYSKTGEVF